MEICNKCGKEIEEGYLEDNYFTYCDKCVNELYTKEELNQAYNNDMICWTTFYDN